MQEQQTAGVHVKLDKHTDVQVKAARTPKEGREEERRGTY